MGSQMCIRDSEKTEHAFADNFLKLRTKQGPHAHPFLIQPTWQRNIFLILIRGFIELIINPVGLIYRLFIIRFRKVTILLLMFEHSCNSGVITICVITFGVKKVIIFCVGKLLHFAVVLHFAAIITFCGVTYIRIVCGVRGYMHELFLSKTQTSEVRASEGF